MGDVLAEGVMLPGGIGADDEVEMIQRSFQSRAQENAGHDQQHGQIGDDGQRKGPEELTVESAQIAVGQRDFHRADGYLVVEEPGRANHRGGNPLFLDIHPDALAMVAHIDAGDQLVLQVGLADRLDGFKVVVPDRQNQGVFDEGDVFIGFDFQIRFGFVRGDAIGDEKGNG